MRLNPAYIHFWIPYLPCLSCRPVVLDFAARCRTGLLVSRMDGTHGDLAHEFTCSFPRADAVAAPILGSMAFTMASIAVLLDTPSPNRMRAETSAMRPPSASPAFRDGSTNEDIKVIFSQMWLSNLYSKVAFS